MTLAIFDVPVTPVLPNKFRVKWPFHLGEAKKIFEMATWRPSWISNPNNFYKSLQSFLPRFESIGLLIQEKKWKTDFQDCPMFGHLGFWIRTILLFFDLQATLIFPFESAGLSVQEKKWKIDFQDGSHGGHLGFPILAIFDLQVTLILPTMFQIHKPFSTEEAKNRFQKGPPLLPSWISDRNNFLSTSHPDASYQVSSQLPFWFRRRS